MGRGSWQLKINRWPNWGKNGDKKQYSTFSYKQSKAVNLKECNALFYLNKYKKKDIVNFCISGSTNSGVDCICLICCTPAQYSDNKRTIVTAVHEIYWNKWNTFAQWRNWHNTIWEWLGKRREKKENVEWMMYRHCLGTWQTWWPQEQQSIVSQFVAQNCTDRSQWHLEWWKSTCSNIIQLSKQEPAFHNCGLFFVMQDFFLQFALILSVCTLSVCLWDMY